MITRNGFVISNQDCDPVSLKKELTVRPIIEGDYGFSPPSFNIWRKISDGYIIPRYYAAEKFPTITPADTRADFCNCNNITFNGRLSKELRQDEAIERGLKAFHATGGGVLSLPCGFGKTVCALAFSAKLKVRTMIVVHKEFLANQWVEKIREFCPDATIGRVQGSIFDIEKDFVIALIQTVTMREFHETAFDSIGLLIVDEAHHTPSKCFSQIMFKINPKYTLGLTATPERKDGLTRLLYWYLGPEFFRIERTDQKSTWVKTLYFFNDAFKQAPPINRAGKINMAEMVATIIEIIPRNDLILRSVNQALSEGRKILVLTGLRSHCFHLQNILGNTLSGLYIGGLKEAELLESSKKQVIIATFQLANEGLDIPALDTVILATPKSDIKQSIGRIMRETPGKKNDPLIIDIVDHWSIFFSMYNKRKKVYHAGGFKMDDESNPKNPVEDKCMFI